MSDTNGSDQPFDIDAWLDGASLPEKTVPIYLDGRTWGQWDTLRARAEKLKADIRQRDKDSDGLPIEEPMGAPGLEAQLQKVVDEMGPVVEALQASRRDIRLRTLTVDELRDIEKTIAPQVKAAKDPKNDQAQELLIDARLLHRTAAATVEPKMSVADMEKLRNAIGQAQWIELAEAMGALINSGVVDADFSLAPSATPSITGS